MNQFVNILLIKNIKANRLMNIVVNNKVSNFNKMKTKTIYFIDNKLNLKLLAKKIIFPTLLIM